MAWRSSEDDITVHVDWLARRLTQQQEDVAATEQHRITMSGHRVSRVPSHVRLAKRDAYTPGLVAIGPLHAGESAARLRPGYRLKMSYLHRLVSRGHPNPSTHLAVIKEYIATVAAREREARAMYAAEDVDHFRAEDLVEMMVLDGCFIIEHLVNVATGHEEQAVHATPFGPTQLSVDLVLAENQIPFFVLVDLINETMLPEFDIAGFTPPVLLMKLTLYYLAGGRGRDMAEGAVPRAEDVSHILHLLHATVTAARTRWVPPPPRIIPDQDQDGEDTLMEMVHATARMLRLLPLLVVVMLLYPTVPEERRWSSRYGPVDVPTASDMRWLWVRLKKAQGKVAGGIMSVLGPVPLRVRLLEGQRELQLPQLRIDFRTAPLLLNLIAFEQLADQRAGDVSAYAWFMAKLVESPEDAAVLAAAEVVERSIAGGGSNEDVAQFFRLVGSASEAAGKIEESYLGGTLERLRKRSAHPLLTRRADVQRYYIVVPWRLIAAFVTVVTTVATVIQTVVSLNQKS